MTKSDIPGVPMVSKAARLTTLVALGALVVLGVGFALRAHIDEQPYPDARLANVDARMLPARSRRVAGIIEATETHEATAWAVILSVKTDDGKTLPVVLNRFSSVQVSSSPRLDSEAGASNPFPYRVMGFRFDGSTRPLGTGLLGLQHFYVTETATIGHP